MPFASGGGKAEREAFLTGLLGGETIGACGDLEPEASLDAWTLKTMASSSGSGFKLTGEKAMVLNAPLAGAKILTALVGDVPALFLVSPDASGIEMSPPQTKVGCRGVPTADVSLKDCAAVKAADWAMQITGQEGYRSGSRAERIFRDAKLLEILGDCTEKHRMFIVDQVLAAY